MEKHKRQLQVGSSSRQVGGLAFNPSGGELTFLPHDISSPEHFFCASDFRMGIFGGNLHMLFGFQSPFEDSERYRVAIELEMPLQPARAFLFDSVWNKPSINGVGKYIDSVKMQAAVTEDSAPETGVSSKGRKLGLPPGTDSFRNFACNFAMSSVSTGQAMIEFLEASPDVLVQLISGTRVRVGAEVRSVVGIILTPSLALKFYEEAKALLENVKPREDKCPS